MVIDGKAIAKEILDEIAATIKTLPQAPRLTVFTCAPNFETQKFLALKQKRADEVGIVMEVVNLSPTTPTLEILRTIEEVLTESDGVVVQLPFPPSVDIKAILEAVPASHDVDVLNYQGEDTATLPPVIGAIDAISRKHNVTFAGAYVVVVGQGRLVGAPAAMYARSQGATVTVLTKDAPNYTASIKQADILILGTGVPGLITPDMVKPGVVVFDAGTSEEGGMLVGDALPSVVAKATLFTPVPGGIGPMTIAVLLKNVLQLAKLHSKNDVNML